MIRKLLILWLLTAVPALCDVPKIFQPLDFATATSRAKEEKKWLLVDATASWCPPCHKMDATTWVDPAMENYAQGKLVAIQIDVDEQAELAEKLGIKAMPTVIIFGPDGELDRSVGYKTSEEMMAWFTDLSGGITQTDRLREKAKTGDIEARYDLAGHLLESGKVAEAEELFIPLWTDMATADGWGGVRYSYLLSSLESLAEQSPSAKTRLEKLRDGAKEKGELEDWFFLSKGLGHQDELLAWQPPKPVSPRIQEFYFEFLIENDALAKAGNLIEDPLTYAKESLERRKSLIDSVPEGEDMREQIVEYANDSTRAGMVSLYQACLAAGRAPQAAEVRKLALEDDPSLKETFDELDAAK